MRKQPMFQRGWWKSGAERRVEAMGLVEERRFSAVSKGWGWWKSRRFSAALKR